MDVSLVSLVSPEPSAPAKPAPASDAQQFDQLLAAGAQARTDASGPPPRPSLKRPDLPATASPRAVAAVNKPRPDHGASAAAASKRPTAYAHGNDDSAATDPASSSADATSDSNDAPATGNDADQQTANSGDTDSQSTATASGNDPAQTDAGQSTTDGTDQLTDATVVTITAAVVAAPPVATAPVLPAVAEQAATPAQGTAADGTAAAPPPGATPDLGAALSDPATPAPSSQDGATAAPTTAAKAAASTAAADFAALASATAEASAALTATVGSKGGAPAAPPAGTGKTAAEVMAQINSANVVIKMAAASQGQDPGQSALGDLLSRAGGGTVETATPATNNPSTVSGETLFLSQLGEAGHHGEPIGPTLPTEPTAPMPGEANAVVANGTSAPSATASSAAPSAPARPAPVLLPLLDQVLPSLSQAASGNGSGRFTIQLRPPELGRIQVDLKIAADGHVTATIVADRQDTLSLLQRDSHQLEQSLSDAGLSTNNGDLQFSLSGDSQGTDFDEPNASSYNAGIAATATVEDTAAPAVARQIGGLSLVDLHV